MTIIRWLGQACFLLTTMHGLVILIDPPHPELGYPITSRSIPAQAVFVSHQHFDHNYIEAAKSPTVIVMANQDAVPGKFDTVVVTGPTLRAKNEIPRGGFASGTLVGTIDGHPISVPYRRIFAYHDDQQGTVRGPDVITTWDIDGLRFAHLGDLGQLALTPDQIAAIGKVDVLMIPVGGFFTIDGPQAAAIVDELKPRVILPMHYQTPALTPDIQEKLHPVSEFLTAMQGVADVVTPADRDLTLSPETLPKKPTIYILKYE